MKYNKQENGLGIEVDVRLSGMHLEMKLID